MHCKFDKAYNEIADKLGVVLASRDDPDKTFTLTTRESLVFGMILGLGGLVTQ